jgi:hypothetical protein
MAFCVLSEELAYHPNVLDDRRVGRILMLPDFRDQLVLRHGPAGRSHKALQNSKGLRRERNGSLPSDEEPAIEVEAILFESIRAHFLRRLKSRISIPGCHSNIPPLGRAEELN